MVGLKLDIYVLHQNIQKGLKSDYGRIEIQIPIIKFWFIFHMLKSDYGRIESFVATECILFASMINCTTSHPSSFLHFSFLFLSEIVRIRINKNDCLHFVNNLFMNYKHFRVKGLFFYFTTLRKFWGKSGVMLNISEKAIFLFLLFSLTISLSLVMNHVQSSKIAVVNKIASCVLNLYSKISFG